MRHCRIYLKTPRIEELDYRIQLLSDAETMNYNLGYGENGSGCYYLTKDTVKKWYTAWVGCPCNYYAYILKKEDNTPIGDVSIHYDNVQKLYMLGIVIEAAQREKGYAEEALRLLINKAFTDMKLEQIANTFPADRTAAERLFQKVGFKRVNDSLLILTRDTRARHP